MTQVSPWWPPNQQQCSYVVPVRTRTILKVPLYIKYTLWYLCDGSRIMGSQLYNSCGQYKCRIWIGILNHKAALPEQPPELIHAMNECTLE